MRVSRVLVLSLVLMAFPAHAGPVGNAPRIDRDVTKEVKFPSLDENSTRITGYFIAPFGFGPHAAVVAMHGYGGLFKQKNGKPSKKMVDWARRLNAAGYAVLFPGSFRSRSLGSICGVKNRPVTEKQRARDAEGAAEWLAKQPNIDPRRIALLGWSNGGTTSLWATEPNRPGNTVEFVTAIAFYPWCRDILDTTTWNPRIPLTILIGGSDNWTPPEPCDALADRWGVKISVFQGAYHSFDHPSLERELHTGMALSKHGKGLTISGTDPAARRDAIKEVMRLLDEATVPR